MKRIIFTLVMIIAFTELRAQPDTSLAKGNISFTFNKTDIKGPIMSIIIRKENNVLISVYARMEQADAINNIHLDFAIPGLVTGAKVVEDYTSFDYQTNRKNSKENNTMSSSFHFASVGSKAHYTTLFAQFEYPASPTKVSLDEVSFKDGRLKIRGSFEGVYTIPEEQIADVSRCEVKNGKFEIIL